MGDILTVLAIAAPCMVVTFFTTVLGTLFVLDGIDRWYNAILEKIYLRRNDALYRRNK